MELNKHSQKTVHEIMKMYKDGGSTVPSSFSSEILVHIYSAHDTVSDDGILNGYYQNRFFKMVVFDLNTMKAYRPEGFFDAIFTDGVDIENVTVFKDGATCLKIVGGAKYLGGQACTFYKEK